MSSFILPFEIGVAATLRSVNNIASTAQFSVNRRHHGV